LLDSNQAKMLFQGNKTLIVKDKEHYGVVGNHYYVLGGNESRGIIKINKVYPIDEKQFEELASKHRISKADKEKWWKGKKILFAYEFEVVDCFEYPELVQHCESESFIVEEVKFLSELAKRSNYLINNLSSYSAVEEKTVDLENDLKIVLAWFQSKETDKPINLSEEEMKKVFKSIIGELLKRKNYSFDSSELGKKTKKFFEETVKEIKEQSIKKNNIEKIEDNETIMFKSFRLMSPKKVFKDENELVNYLYG